MAWNIESVPAQQTLNPGGGFQYQITAKQDPGTLHIQRQMMVGGILYGVEAYPAIRRFFSLVKTNDEQQAVITVGASSATHN